MFGAASKPAFGTGASTGGGLFGNTSSGATFGQGNAQPSGLFGAQQSTALTSTNVAADCQGTGNTPFQPLSEKESPGGTATNNYQSISCMAPYSKYSYEVYSAEPYP